MTKMRNRSIWIVVLADVLITYAYAFAANAWMDNSLGPEAPVTYWLTQLWVYSLIVPVAVVASWRGTQQVLDAWDARPRWWRLPLEGMGIGAASIVLLGLLNGWGSDFLPTLRDVIRLCGGLGLLLTGANAPLARLLRPDRASMHRTHPA
jgi:hypothetical protein